jgi:hypothetical protein
MSAEGVYVGVYVGVDVYMEVDVMCDVGATPYRDVEGPAEAGKSESERAGDKR